MTPDIPGFRCRDLCVSDSVTRKWISLPSVSLLLVLALVLVLLSMLMLSLIWTATVCGLQFQRDKLVSERMMGDTDINL
jgi:hypothetical protein